MAGTLLGTVSLATFAMFLGLLAPAGGAAQELTPNPAVRPRVPSAHSAHARAVASTPAPLSLHRGLTLGEHARNLHVAAGVSLGVGIVGGGLGALSFASSDSLHDLGVASGLVGGGLVLAGSALVLGVVAIVLERL